MEENEVKKDSLKEAFITSFRTIVFVWKKEPKLLIINFILAVILAAIVYLQLSSFSNIVNEIVRIQRYGLGITHILIKQSVILGLSFLIPAVLQNLDGKYFDELNNKLGTHISLLQIDSFSALDIGTFQSTEFQTKHDRAQKWGTGSINNIIFYSKGMVRGMAGFITSGIVLFFINPYLVLLAVIGAMPYYFIEKKFGKELYNLTWTWTDETRLESNARNYFRDVKKIVEILLFNLKAFFRARAKELAEAYDKKIVKIKTRESFATFGADFVQTICLFIAIALVTYESLHGKLLVGSLLLAFTVYRSFVSTSQNFFENFSRLEDQARFAQRWYDLFDIKPKILNKEHALKPSYSTPPKIEFRNVSFIYPDTDVLILKNISFILESGQKLAVVGENGAGKTTLIKLLCRVYDPSEGQILINDKDLRDIDLEYWRNYLAVLLQDFNNYEMTVKEAIAISRPYEKIDNEKVIKAAQMSGADSFIEELPKKYDQLLWKGFKDGVELSKGQFQRMAVARIFYRDALISVLDEPTSAIDAVAEEKIFEVLEKKMEGKTVVLISHRFSTVKNADKIAVIEHGELKELGTHKELMEKHGRYQELFTMQANRYLDSE